MDTAIDLQLHLEDRSHWNNLRLRGISEATGRDDFQETVTAIFQKVLASHPPKEMELDTVHRVLGPRSADTDRPRDVVCRVHHFTQKETILRKAWDLWTLTGPKLRSCPTSPRPLYNAGHSSPGVESHPLGRLYLSQGIPPGSHLP